MGCGVGEALRALLWNGARVDSDYHVASLRRFFSSKVCEKRHERTRMGRQVSHGIL
jgi:hypothetical protein